MAKKNKNINWQGLIVVVLLIFFLVVIVASNNVFSRSDATGSTFIGDVWEDIAFCEYQGYSCNGNSYTYCMEQEDNTWDAELIDICSGGTTCRIDEGCAPIADYQNDLEPSDIGYLEAPCEVGDSAPWAMGYYACENNEWVYSGEALPPFGDCYIDSDCSTEEICVNTFCVNDEEQNNTLIYVIIGAIVFLITIVLLKRGKD